MAVQAHRTPHLSPRPNPAPFARFGAAVDLTCNTTAHKKRSRDEPEVSHQYIPLPSLFNMPQQQQSRVYGSHDTSTTGRISAPPAIDVQVAQDLEIDAFIRFQAERMRSELEVVRKRQCRDLMSVVGQQVVNRMKEKDVELERARRRTAELEQNVTELAAKSQIWFNIARNNEATVCSLRSAVDQALLQNAALAEHGDCGSAQPPADDAESCCYEGLDREPAVRQRTACRVCGEKEVCVLILPCRHLCLCNDCEPSFDTCPVRLATKNASLQVLLS